MKHSKGEISFIAVSILIGLGFLAFGYAVTGAVVALMFIAFVVVERMDT